MQLLDAGRTVTEPLAVYERVVLTDGRRRTEAYLPRIGKGDRDAHADDIGHASELRMLQRDLGRYSPWSHRTVTQPTP